MSVVERSTWIFIIAHMVLLCSGARAIAEDPAALVRGKITVDGQPVAAGKIFFFIGINQDDIRRSVRGQVCRSSCSNCGECDGYNKNR
jgi:hypothetical protein